MKKIKYGNRKNQIQNKELQSLKQGDQICQAVLDTLSDDYLNYITHLIGHSKTPIKTNIARDKEQASSDSQALEKPTLQQSHNKQKNNNLKQEPRTRHHSETGGKHTQYHVSKDQPIKNSGKGYYQDLPRKYSYHKDRQTISRDKMAQKKKKKRVEDLIHDSLIRNQQKTMSFTRNYQYPFHVKDHDVQYFKKGPTVSRSKESTQLKQKQKYYTNYQQGDYSSNQQLSINDTFFQQNKNIQYPFINEIDNYISHLQSDQQIIVGSNYSFSKKAKDKYSKEDKLMQKKRNKVIEEEYGQYDVQELLKENLKLNKKVKNYQQKIEQLEDEVSSHLIQCKNRDKGYKNKIGQLIKALTQSVSKINSQKTQITTMKSLLHSFGQKVKQIQHQDEDTDQPQQEISESIIRYMGTQKHTLQLKTKHKKGGLQSTMPKHEEDRRYWRQ